MKTVCKNMFKLCAFLLLAAGAAQTATAQKPVVKPRHHYYNTIQAIRPGDSIYVHPDSLYYLTGERISKWVFDVPHQVQQVGGRRYPMGVLIKGIYSWVYPYTLVPVEIEVADDKYYRFISHAPILSFLQQDVKSDHVKTPGN